MKSNWHLYCCDVTKRKTAKGCLSFWVSPPMGRLHPLVFAMLGGNEFRLRQGFAFGKTLVAAQRRRRSEGRYPLCAGNDTVAMLHVVADFVSFATTFLQKSSLIRSSFPITAASLGHDWVWVQTGKRRHPSCCSAPRGRRPSAGFLWDFLVILPRRAQRWPAPSLCREKRRCNGQRPFAGCQAPGAMV